MHLLLQRTRGPAHPDAAPAHRLLGALYIDAGELARAATHLEKALTSVEIGASPQARDVADTLVELARFDRLRGHTESADARLRRAEAIRMLAGGDVFALR